MTILYLDTIFEQHDTGSHPESPARIRAIHERLQASGLPHCCTQPGLVTAQAEDLQRVHTERHLERLHEWAEAGGGRVEVDTVMSPLSAEIAHLAAGTAVDAVQRVIAGEDTTALCLVRPPGHHALPTGPMGFCLLGNIAIAARTAVQRLGLNRVLIVDWDVHHGNGTQDVFYEDEQVGFFSIHRFPFYPGTGRKTETGRGPGLGTTFNLPLDFGVSSRDYMTAFRAMLSDAADRMKPELVLVSAGFDAHAEDPVGSLGLESEHFCELTRAVREVAATHAAGRLVSVLEGGYNVQRLAECVEIHLQALLE